MLPKPAWATSSRGISDEPAITVWTSPRRISSAPSPTQLVPVEQAVTMHMLCPMAPVSIAIIPDVRSTSPLAMNVGATGSGPLSCRTIQLSSIRVCPPAPVPEDHADVLAVGIADLQAGVPDSLLGGGDAIPHCGLAAADGLGVHPRPGIEVTHLARHSACGVARLGADLDGSPGRLFYAFHFPEWNDVVRLYGTPIYTLLIGVLLLVLWGTLVRPSARRFAAIGLVTGLIGLARPTGPFILLVVLAWLWFAIPLNRGRRLRWLGGTLLCFLLVLSPWVVRNYAVFGKLMLSDTNGGGNLYIEHPGGHGVSAPQCLPGRPTGAPGQRRRVRSGSHPAGGGHPQNPGRSGVVCPAVRETHHPVLLSPALPRVGLDTHAEVAPRGRGLLPARLSGLVADDGTGADVRQLPCVVRALHRPDCMCRSWCSLGSSFPCSLASRLSPRWGFRPSSDFFRRRGNDRSRMRLMPAGSP